MSLVFSTESKTEEFSMKQKQQAHHCSWLQQLCLTSSLERDVTDSRHSRKQTLFSQSHSLSLSASKYTVEQK